jgi:hypothetical protein
MAINNLNMTPLPLLTYMLTEALNKIMKIKSCRVERLELKLIFIIHVAQPDKEG